MASCEQYWELISASLDNALTLEEQARLDEHLAQCPECREMWAQLSGLEAELMELEEPGKGFVDGVMAAAAELEQDIPFTNLPQNRKVGGEVRGQVKAWWRPLRNWCAIAACLLVVLGLGSLIARLGGAGMSTGSGAATAEDAAYQTESASDGEGAAPSESPEQDAGAAAGSGEQTANAPAEDAAPERESARSEESRPMLHMEDGDYVSSDMPVEALPEGFALAGTLTEEQAGESGLAGCEYYTSPDRPGECYVWQQCGVPAGGNTADTTQYQWAYVRWVLCE